MSAIIIVAAVKHAIVTYHAMYNESSLESIKTQYVMSGVSKNNPTEI